MIRASARTLAIALGLCLTLAACTSGVGGAADPAPTEEAALEQADQSEAAVVPTAGSRYEIEVASLGQTSLGPLRRAVPVGRVVESAVTLTIGDDDITGTVRIEVLNARADGSEQRLSAELTSIGSSNNTLLAGFDDADDVRSVLVRDARGAVLVWQPELPAGLPSRVAAIVELLLESPFAFAGPLPLEPVGPDGEWSITFTDGGGSTDGAVAAPTTIRSTLVGWTDDVFEVQFTSGLASGEVRGTADDVVPHFQRFDSGATIVLVETTRVP